MFTFEDVMSGRAPEVIEDVYYELPQFVFDHGTMQNFTHYGDRKEFPLLNDEEWSKVNWDYFQDCFTCDSRHRCGQTLSREHYRKAKRFNYLFSRFLYGSYLDVRCSKA